MMDQKTIENNRLIAEFMGFKFNAYPDQKHYNITNPGKTDWFYASWDLKEYEKTFNVYFNYNESLDKIMQVVDRIETIPPKVIRNLETSLMFNGEYNFCITSAGQQFSCYSSDRIDAIYGACIQYIKFYNKENKETHAKETSK